MPLAVHQAEARANLRDLAARVEALIFLTRPEGYPGTRREERDAVREAMQALSVKCPRCLTRTFDEAGSNGDYFRFKCSCEPPPASPVVILRYPCMWQRLGRTVRHN